MAELTCLNCDEDFETEERFPDDEEQCPHCKTWMETDMEEDWDNLYFWATKIIEK